MRNILTLSALVFSMAIASQSHAQSGNRGGGGGGFGGSGSGKSLGSSFGGIGNRLSRAEQQQLAQQQAEFRQLQALQESQLRAEQAKRQFKQTLVQLADSDSRSVNSRQNRQALAEAKGDFKNLRKKQIAPNLLGPLQVPFRLTDKEIDREKFTVTWPESLEGEEFESLVQRVDKAIKDRAITSEESAAQFLVDLGQLNSALNRVAAEGGVDISSYAKARRFITGLANEVRATDLVM